MYWPHTVMDFITDAAQHWLSICLACDQCGKTSCIATFAICELPAHQHKNLLRLCMSFVPVCRSSHFLLCCINEAQTSKTRPPSGTCALRAFFVCVGVAGRSQLLKSHLDSADIVFIHVCACVCVRACVCVCDCASAARFLVNFYFLLVRIIFLYCCFIRIFALQFHENSCK